MNLAEFVNTLTWRVRGQRDADRFESTLDDISRTSDRTGSRLGRLGGRLSVIGAGAAVTAGAFSTLLDAAVQVENGMVGVARTTGLAGEQLDELRDEIGRLGSNSTVGASLDQLFELAETAGQLGVQGVDDITEFTRVLAQLSNATQGRLQGESAGQLFSSILRASGESIENVENLASSFVFLGNTFAVNEAQISSRASRLANSLRRFQPASQDIAGLAAGFAELQIGAELSGTTVTQTLIQLETAIAEGGDALAAFTEITGQSQAQLRESLNEDAVGAFTDIVEGLSRASDAGQPLPLLLERVGLSGVRTFSTLASLAAGSDRLAETLAASNMAFEQNVALQEEAGLAGQTYEARVQALSNQWTIFLDNLAQVGVIDVATGFIDQLSQGLTFLGAQIDMFTDGLEGILGFFDRINQSSIRFNEGLRSIPSNISDGIGNIAGNAVDNARIIGQQAGFIPRTVGLPNSTSTSVSQNIRNEINVQGSNSDFQTGQAIRDALNNHFQASRRNGDLVGSVGF